MAPLTALSGPALASTPGPNTPEAVSSGINAALLPGATVFGTTPADTPETVSFILRERNISFLKAAVTSGVKSYLSVGQFAAAFGQTPANISALTSYLAHYGIKTTVYVYYTGNPGQPYNEAVGLGFPNLTKMARDFAGGRD